MSILKGTKQTEKTSKGKEARPALEINSDVDENGKRLVSEVDFSEAITEILSDIETNDNQIKDTELLGADILTMSNLEDNNELALGSVTAILNHSVIFNGLKFSPFKGSKGAKLSAMTFKVTESGLRESLARSIDKAIVSSEIVSAYEDNTDDTEATNKALESILSRSISTHLSLQQDRAVKAGNAELSESVNDADETVTMISIASGARKDYKLPTAKNAKTDLRNIKKQVRMLVAASA